MRLINCETLQLKEFLGSAVPRYAILSHTWSNEEVSFAEFNIKAAAENRASEFEAVPLKDGHKKIIFTCTQALKDGLQYAWVDTCCIDKSSSAELSEAINSMFQWYKHSSICYAYLSDVTLEAFDATFAHSRWFRRGWTLQELIAPEEVMFFDRDYEALGTKSKYLSRISEITGIDKNALRWHYYPFTGSLGAYCAAQRMSWAADRETTRVEDIAYSLLGIFNISMPLLYGEGAMAFICLQEEIIKRTDDQSIFAWGLDTEAEEPSKLIHGKLIMSRYDPLVQCPILAQSPQDFSGCRRLQYGWKPLSPFTMTNVGLQIELPLLPIYPSLEHHFAGLDSKDVCGWIGLLNCISGAGSELLGIILWGYKGDDYETVRMYPMQKINIIA